MAIVHDYLTQRGGAERVVLALLEAFPGSRLVTSVYEPDRTYAEFRGYQVETTWLQGVSSVRQDPRRALPLLPKVFGSHVIDDVDVVLSSSSGFAHGVQTSAPKVVYCHNPARWLYQPEDYLASLPRLARRAFMAGAAGLRSWDQKAAAGATAYLVNSTVVAERVAAAYDRQAQVLPPPVSIETDAARDPVAGVAPGFFLTIGRARGYKNTDVVAEAVAQLPGARLVAVGGLPPRSDGRAWPDTHIGVTDITDGELRWLYAEARALVAVSYEDFGLTPCEAYAFGTPAVVLRAGGYLDTSADGISGVFVDEPTVPAVVAALQRFLATVWDSSAIRAHGERWSRDRFAENIWAVVEQAQRQAGTGRTRPGTPRPRRVVVADRRAGAAPPPVERRGAKHLELIDAVPELEVADEALVRAMEELRELDQVGDLEALTRAQPDPQAELG